MSASKIEEAIARSISHNEIVAVEVCNADGALGVIREMYGEIDHTSAGDFVDVCTEEWRLRITPDYDAIARASIEGWDHNLRDFGKLEAGFIAWCWADRQETLDYLTDGEDAGIVRELVYAAKQRDWGFRLDDDELWAAFSLLLEANRAEFVTALRESLSSD